MEDNMSDFSMYGDYDSYEHSDTSEDVCNDLAELDVITQPTTQTNKPRLPNFYPNGSVGMATCEMCGTVGVKHAFYSKSKRFCSIACSRTFSGTRKKAGKPLPVKKIKVEPQKKVIVPVEIKPVDETAGFSWQNYLSSHDVQTPPVSSFKHCAMSKTWDGIHVGMKVETVNTAVDLPKPVYWIATVLKVTGYKALLCYEGFDMNIGHDYWVNLCNKDIHEVGWCATTGNSLVPPTVLKDKYPDWKEFLVKRLIGSRTLPSGFYDMVQQSFDDNRLQVGMNVEVIDKSCVSAMCVATVEEVIGGRLHLQYSNSKFEYEDFWCHKASRLVHEVGWAERIGHKLHATDSYREACATKNALNAFDKEDSTSDMFPNIPQVPGSMQFHVGMKLEAIDPLNLSAICVSTVMKVLRDNYVMICIDRSKEVTGTDWFCYHSSSPSLLPAGFCEINNIELTPPKGYNKNTFHWEDYLRVTQSVVAPVRIFEKEMRNHGFKVGMKIEAVDLMDPRLICVATITRVVGRLLRIHFDGWESDYDQWVDCDSPDLFPIGWCDLVDYPLEGPKFKDNSQALLYTAKKRRGKLSVIKGPRKKKRRIDQDDIAPVMYGGGDNDGVTVKVEPMSPSIGNSSDRAMDQLFDTESQDSMYTLNDTITIKQEPSDIVATKPLNSSLAASRPALAATLLSPSLSPTKTTAPVFTTSSSRAIKAMLNRSGADKPATTRSPGSSVKVVTHIPRFLVVDSDKTSSSLLAKSTSTLTAAGTTLATKPTTQLTQSIVPELWSIYNVCQFLKINDCGSYCDSFSRKGIDGKKLLQLSKEQIASLTGMKVGPSLKVYELIQQLKSKITDSGSGAVRDAVNLKQS